MMMRFAPPTAPLIALCLGLLVVGSGCFQTYHVVVEGSLEEYRRGDSVFVSLTKNWESIRLAPDRFEIKPNGSFVLEFAVRCAPPPVTFVKNGKTYAMLTVHNLRDPCPFVVDEDRGKTFDISVDKKRSARVKVRL
jgi:hypothetical protein